MLGRDVLPQASPGSLLTVTAKPIPHPWPWINGAATPSPGFSFPGGPGGQSCCHWATHLVTVQWPLLSCDCWGMSGSLGWRLELVPCMAQGCLVTYKQLQGLLTRGQAEGSCALLSWSRGSDTPKARGPTSLCCPRGVGAVPGTLPRTETALLGTHRVRAWAGL